MYPKGSTSNLVGREPCPKCRAEGHDAKGDNLGVFDDGHKYCFKCGYQEQNGTKMQTAIKQPEPITERTGAYEAIPDRRLSVVTTKKFDITVAPGKHYYNYHDAHGNLIATKVRNTKDKTFYAKGNLQGAMLFGQKSCRGSGKFITITEGELDAASVSEMFQNKWDVVSLKTGAAGAVRDIKQHLEFLEGYDNVVLCFDNDEAGRKAVDAVLPLFSHGKAKVMTLPLKDASEMLQANRIREFTSAFWDAKAHHPVGILSFSDKEMWDSFVRRGTEEIIPMPEAYGALNQMMGGGIAAGEITIIGALTSIGKSTMVYNLLYDLLTTGNKKVGAVFLEADRGEIVEKTISLHLGQNISIIPANKRDYTAYRTAYDDLIKDDKLHILDHQGSSDADILFSKMRYLVKGLDCEVIILDPLQAAVTSNENGMIDQFMDNCLKLAKETGVSIIVVSHLRKPSSNDPHAVSEYDTKGSGSINQIAFNTILLSRDKLSDNPIERNSTKVQLVKCRRTGNTGVAGWLYYDSDSGRLIQGEEPSVAEANNIMEF